MSTQQETRLIFGVEQAIDVLDKHHIDHGAVAVAGVHLATAIKALRAAVRLRKLAIRVAGYHGTWSHDDQFDADVLSHSACAKFVYQMPDALCDAVSMAFVPRPVLGSMGQTIARIDERNFLDGCNEMSALGLVGTVTQETLGLRWVMGINSAAQVLRGVFKCAGVEPSPQNDGALLGITRGASYGSAYRRLASAEPHMIAAPGVHRGMEVYYITRATLVMASVMGEFK